jgi:hypothetical protein
MLVILLGSGRWEGTWPADNVDLDDVTSVLAGWDPRTGSPFCNSEKSQKARGPRPRWWSTTACFHQSIFAGGHRRLLSLGVTDDQPDSPSSSPVGSLPELRPANDAPYSKR